ncbi:MAG: hypothetical protein PF689_05060 [Deltaproteobacteria bacterium]|jgi:hypothetical protein|nr:hypothetical protein [Deltaproteobacteria bacterium]
MKQKKSFFEKWLTHGGFILSYCAITGAALYTYSDKTFSYIRQESDSLTTDFMLRIGFYIGILLFSFGVGLFFDRFFNSSRWVNRHFGTTDTRQKEKENLQTTSARMVKSGQAQFYIAIFASVISSYLVIDSIHGNFNSWYGSQGQYLVRLRSKDPEVRIEAIKHLAKTPNKKNSRLFIDKIRNGTEGEKLTTAWILGKSNYKLDIILEEYRKILEESSNPQLQRTAVLALSRMIDNPTVSTVNFLRNKLRKYFGENKIPPREFLFSAAFLRSSEFLHDFLHLFKIDDEELRVILTYALVWIKGVTPGQNHLIINRLKNTMKSGSERLKCMTTVALAFKFNSINTEILGILRREFEAKSSTFKCKPEVFSLHPYGKKTDTINITRLSIRGFKYPAFGKVRYRERILRVLALNRDDTMIPWLKRMAKNKNLPKYLQELAAQVARKKFERKEIVNW